MKHLLTFLSLSLIFSQELEVEGDLKVTGDIQAAKLDSMQAVIDSLKAELAAMQVENRLETRAYELPRFNFEGETIIDLDLSQITGFNLNYAILKIIYVSDFSTGSTQDTQIQLRCSATNYDGYNVWRTVTVELHSNGGSVFYGSEMGLTYVGTTLQLRQPTSDDNHIGYVDIIFSVTAQFPD